MSSKLRQVKQYMKQVLVISRAKKPVFQVTLSFSEMDKSKQSDAKLKQISKYYLTQMGYEKQRYIVYRHDDKKYPHVHIF